MKELFRGWRRKFGMVTLVIACVLTAGWIRSVQSCDYLEIHCGPACSVLVASKRCGIECQFYWKPSPGLSFEVLWGARIRRSIPVETPRLEPNDDERLVCFNPNEIVYTDRLIQLIESVRYQNQFAIRIPYWSAVLPLILLSAYLLLCKPRPRKPPDEAKVTHA